MHSLKTAVLVSYGCCNKWWLKIMLEIKAQISISVRKSRCQQATLPPRALGENLFPASSEFRWARLSLACGHSTPVSASEVTWPSLLSVRSLSASLAI